uniref:Helicase ATP-binding domain-containing protein n=1 Tax=Sinocyclocheilus rhinocerous TaxID=307959 RepID=A0A673NIG0_9TELE
QRRRRTFYKLIQTVKENTFLIVTGEAGSGKTTQLPQYLYKAGFCRTGVTQPRRVAAITVVQRVSHEMGVWLGEEVGYQVRFDDCSTKNIRFLKDHVTLKIGVMAAENSA